MKISLTICSMAMPLVCCLFACRDLPQLQEGSTAKQTTIQREQKTVSIDTAQILRNISNEVQRINDSLGRYATVEKEIFGESSEGGGLIAYFDRSNNLKKIETTFYGEMGKAVIVYYFNDRKVFLIVRQEYAYDKPMYIEGSQIASMLESEYYFYNGRMIRLKNDGNNPVQPGSDEFLQEEKVLLEGVDDLLSEL